jgi:quinoprotein dehydrogenase-associated probable ABC transporter substrate-binding protein
LCPLWFKLLLSHTGVPGWVSLVAVSVIACHTGTPSRELRVCSDPNNLPFSNQRQEGFENRIAELIAGELRANLRYTWWAERRGYIRNTLNAGRCDVVMGMPSGTGNVLTTRPYYRSTYVFVSRRDQHLTVKSLDDPVLRRLKIGVQVVGDDYANTPPVHALSRRGIVDNIVGFRVVGDYSQANPPARIIDAVAAGEVDVAVAWGPLAGYFAKRSPVPLVLTPVLPGFDPPGLRFVFDISLAVRRDAQALERELDQILEKRKPAIDSILTEYGVPGVS